jgi:hypothetical protein
LVSCLHYLFMSLMRRVAENAALIQRRTLVAGSRLNE